MLTVFPPTNTPGSCAACSWGVLTIEAILGNSNRLRMLRGPVSEVVLALNRYRSGMWDVSVLQAVLRVPRIWYFRGI